MRYQRPETPPPDANLAAGALAKTLEQPFNLGIGTLPGHHYQPISAEHIQSGSDFLLKFLGLRHSPVSVVPAKGGGTGAIALGLAVLRALGYQYQSLGFSPWDWAGYESFCAAQGVGAQYLDEAHYTTADPDCLMLIQTNRNGAGTRLSVADAEAIVAENNRLQRPNFIDLPYFTGSPAEKAVLQVFQTQAQQPTVIAWSPTKIFQTFTDRPGGVTLVLWPDSETEAAFAWTTGAAARGTTGFDDATTRALWQELAQAPEVLLARHRHYLDLIAAATEFWAAHARVEAQPYFDADTFGGMFRLFPAKADTQSRLASKNIVAVLLHSGDQYKVRVNLCGVLGADGRPKAGAKQVVQDFFSLLDL